MFRTVIRSSQVLRVAQIRTASRGFHSSTTLCSSFSSTTNATNPPPTNTGSQSYSTASARNVDTTSALKDLNAKLGGLLSLKGAPTFTKGENVIDLIKSDHRKAEKMYKEYTAEKDMKKKEAISRELVKALVQHSEVEQMLVYPLLKIHESPFGQKIHDRSLTEHQEVRELLYAVDQTKIDDPTHATKLKKAMDANAKHVKEEEEETLPLLAKSYTADELQYVGSAFEVHKYTAPTHPHPSAPMQGPIAAAAGAAAKAGDLARDVAHKVASTFGGGKKEEKAK